jgi:uncharacterized protein YoxC
MADELHVDVEHEKKEISEGERDLERTLGGVESDVEHHGEKLKEHEEHLDSLKYDKEYVEGEIRRIEAMVLAVPAIPTELLKDLTERVTHLEETLTHKVQEVTEIPETVVEKPKEAPHLLDRIL